MTHISSGPDFRVELHRRIKQSLIGGMEDAGASPKEIAEAEGDMSDLASIIADDIGLEILESSDGVWARFPLG